MKQKNICKFVSPAPLNQLVVTCFVLESDPDVMRESVSLSENRVILAVQGTGRLKFGETPIPFSPGTLAFAFKNEIFSVECNQPCEYMYINFDGARAKELFRRFNITKSNRIFGGNDSLIPFWRESLSRANQKTIDLASESILLYTFSRLFANCAQRNTLINEILDILEEQFTNSECSLTAIAGDLGYNAKYLSHYFKTKMDVGFSEYLRTLRIKHAVCLFDHGLDSIKNVALLSGFEDPLYFSTVFKKSLGVSPRDYISSLAKNKGEPNIIGIKNQAL